MRTIGITLVLIMELVLQATFFQFFNINGHSPDFVLVTLIVIGIYFEKEESWKYGLIIGILKDVFFGIVFGVYSLLYFVVVIIISWIGKSMFKESLVAPLILFPVGILVSNLLLFLINYLLGKGIAFSEFVAARGPVYLAVNLVGTLIVYTLFNMLRKRGYLLDKTRI
ncbi:rod shape-determining protein MreD [Alkalibacter mobilis]|uniref:rod shape-determining protein MreD n=1 Tax=Alkalibacter mobilis TaxID=2787712 RepID=UPI00189CB8ED|nr:rod shape-determining protein MreD [Alkalibacter mobilis]MBF7096577.1 rod shape-determining protein MreD [Alkalibacter mobilis]